MSSMTLTQTNGHKPSPTNSLPGLPSLSNSPSSWLQQSTRQFFGGTNWDDQAAEVQELRKTSLNGNSEPLSLALTVQQFFGAIYWDDDATHAPELMLEAFPAALSTPTTESADSLTLDDFSDLF